MRAMILAAGRGERLRPFTDSFPKPLLQLDGKSLLERQIEALRQVDIHELCINLHWLGEHIHSNFSHLPNIHWQWEERLLNTGGSIAKALPWLCEREESFLILNADIYHDFPLYQLSKKTGCWLVVAPQFAQQNQPGDFGVSKELVTLENKEYVYTGIARLQGALFRGYATGDDAQPFPLIDLLRRHIAAKKLGALIHSGEWCDLGTKSRLMGYANRLTNPQGIPLLHP